MKNIIAFTGKKQVGKSTAAGYMNYRHKFERINFKDALVKEIKERFPNLLEEILRVERMRACSPVQYTESIDGLFFCKPPLMRTLMQCYGTDVRRKDDPTYWIRQWEKAVNECDKEFIVVDDVRFINEANMVRSFGGRVYRIERDTILLGQKLDTHQSELEMDNIKVDGVIENNGDTNDLYNKLDKLIL